MVPISQNQESKKIKLPQHGDIVNIMAWILDIHVHSRLLVEGGGSKGAEVLENLREPWALLGKIKELEVIRIPTPVELIPLDNVVVQGLRALKGPLKEVNYGSFKGRFGILTRPSTGVDSNKWEYRPGTLFAGFPCFRGFRVADRHIPPF